MTGTVWLTEDYAMSDFRSVWSRPNNYVVIIMPHQEHVRKGYSIKLLGASIIVTREYHCP